MKTLFTFLTVLIVILSISAMAQSPEKMSYQAVIRDASGILISNQQVGMQISILQGAANGSTVYIETQSPTTNTNGLASFEIGAGQTTDDFSNIDWSAGPYFVKTEVDPAGNGANYTVTATNQLLSVPYAMYAKNGLSAGNSTSDILYWDGNEWQKLAGGATEQVLTMCNGVLAWRTDGFCGEIASLACGSPSNSGTLYHGIPSSGIKSILSYTGGNGYSYSPQTINSTGVTGLTAHVDGGAFSNGAGFLNFDIEGTPSSSGMANFVINIGGQTCTLSREVMPVSYPVGTVHCEIVPTAIVDVTNPVTGKTWMDRNLGAQQVATSSTDELSYGDLYQWGRLADGHQCRSSSTVGTKSNQPNHGNFITSSADWRTTTNDSLWQGVNGENSPCPIGYRLPTLTEFQTEYATWASQNSTSAFNSVLKLPLTGYRVNSSGSFSVVGLNAYYWTSTVPASSNSNYLRFTSSEVAAPAITRAYGFAVRCIKN